MRPLALLKCIGRAALKGAGNAIGLGVAVEIAEDVWKEWNKEANDAQRRAELQSLVRMAAGDFRQQVDAIVREVAQGQPPDVQQRLSNYLQQVPELTRRAFRRPEDQRGESVPPGLPIRGAGDLVPFVSFHAPASPGSFKTEDGEPPSPDSFRTDDTSLSSQASFRTDDTSSSASVALEFIQGQRRGEEMNFTEPTLLLVGRTEGCNPQFPREGHERISRRHCFVEVNPPDIRVRDLGSLHGTFINGNLIGKRPKGTDPGGYESPEHALADGDEVRLADRNQLAFRVRVRGPVAVVKTCAWCQGEVAEPGANRAGLFVCADCRSNVQNMVQGMVGQAHAGNQELRVLSSYALLEELGHGGMGAVYLARHERTDQPAAIKLMLPKVAADDRAVELFHREVANTMTLRHRHVVRLLDHGYARGTFFLILEYCDGGSVDRLMAQRGGKLPVDEAVEITLQALDGLEYTHRADVPFVRQKGGGFAPGKGIVHRDLKPANLFLTGWGSSRIVKVGDYGLAKAFDETGLSGGTRTGDVAGTWQFMCRKQVAQYKDAGPEVDVWAMAATLYNMLTGKLPRDFPKEKDPWLVVLESDAVSILKREPRIPHRLAEVIDQALKEEPEIPYKTAAAFKEALEKAL